jgi:hypothetical protein
MNDDGQAGDVRVRRARGTEPNAATGQAIARSAPAIVRIRQGSTSDEPARTIHEAVERWIVATNAR